MGVTGFAATTTTERRGCLRRSSAQPCLEITRYGEEDEEDAAAKERRDTILTDDKKIADGGEEIELTAVTNVRNV